MNIRHKIEGALYGQAVGDALGMPGELWGRKRIRRQLGIITDFLDGPSDNAVAFNYKAGQFTDDTGQALVLLDSLKETNYIPKSSIVGRNLLTWAENNNAFEQNILGPTSKVALKKVKEGEDASSVTNAALSNGAAMRIAPIGCLFYPEEGKRVAEYVYDLSKATHSSDITIAGASIVALAVSSAIQTNNTRKAIKAALEIEEYALSLGAETFSPSIKKRVEYGISIIEKGVSEQEILDFVYDVIGCGVPTCESVSAALIIAYFTQEPGKCALTCANVGGDTDTIGAMATAICGAAYGIEAFNPDYKKIIDLKNIENLTDYVDILQKGREVLHA